MTKKDHSHRAKRNVVKDKNLIWESGEIPYEIDNSCKYFSLKNLTTKCLNKHVPRMYGNYRRAVIFCIVFVFTHPEWIER